METYNLIITGVLIPFIGAAVWVVKYVLAWAKSSQEKALENWAKQVEALEAVRSSIDCIATSLAAHDEANGVAHRQAAEIQAKVADKLETLYNK